MQSFLNTFSRIFLSITFILSGVLKAIDPVGGAIKIEDYLNAFLLSLLTPLSELLSYSLFSLEFILGICLLLTSFKKFSTLFSLFFILGMSALTLYLAIYNPITDCGCFGDAITLSNWETFWKNIVLLTTALVLFFTKAENKNTARSQRQKLIPVLSGLGIILFALYNHLYLPIIDFRPYKIGANIIELSSIPPNAPKDEYKYSLIYEKNNEQKTFTLENAPIEDSTWVFVDTKEILVKEGYKPTITDFKIFDMHGQDVTNGILADSTGIYLLLMHNTETASRRKAEEINQLYKSAISNGQRLIAIVGSSEETFQQWAMETNANYPMLNADATLIKTIIRSNPGIVFMKNGIITQKKHYNQL